MDATENLNSAAPVQRPWMRKVVLALAYVIVWVVLWHAANVFNRMTGFDLWIPCAGLTFALLLDYGGRALPLPLLAALLAGWPAWSDGKRAWNAGLARSTALPVPSSWRAGWGARRP